MTGPDVNITTATTDENLLAYIAAQNQDALMALYQRYSAMVYGLAMRVLQNQTLAEEVTQDIFMKLWRKPSRWDPALGKLSSWLLATTRNAAIDRIRYEQRRPERVAPPVEEMTHLASAERGVDDPLWLDSQLLGQLLTRLPDEQRQLIELSFFQGYTHSELAERLDMPLGTVKTRLRAGLKRLRTLWHAAEERGLSEDEL